MTREMSVKEFWGIFEKVDDRIIERIMRDSVTIEHLKDGKFQISVGNHIITTVDMHSDKFAVDIMIGNPEGYSKKLIDGLRDAVSERLEEEEEYLMEEPEAPDDDENEEGIMQLAELFEEEEK